MLSVEKVKRHKLSSYKYERHMIVNKKKYNFDKFNDLHKRNYEMIIYKNKFHLSEFESIIKLMKSLKNEKKFYS